MQRNSIVLNRLAGNYCNTYQFYKINFCYFSAAIDPIAQIKITITLTITATPNKRVFRTHTQAK